MVDRKVSKMFSSSHDSRLPKKKREAYPGLPVFGVSLGMLASAATAVPPAPLLVEAEVVQLPAVIDGNSGTARTAAGALPDQVPTLLPPGAPRGAGPVGRRVSFGTMGEGTFRNERQECEYENECNTHGTAPCFPDETVARGDPPAPQCHFQCMLSCRVWENTPTL